jgi:hypothetical protein
LCSARRAGNATRPWRIRLSDQVWRRSGGMRRRLDVAASLVGMPAVLFLDEPTTGLDPRSRGDVWDMVRGMVADGTTVCADHPVPGGSRPTIAQHLREGRQLREVEQLSAGEHVASRPDAGGVGPASRGRPCPPHDRTRTNAREHDAPQVPLRALMEAQREYRH